MELRFTISNKDGKLEKMMDEVPNALRAEFAKEALRYYLRAIRDGEIESDFIDSYQLEKYQPRLNKKVATMEDIKILAGGGMLGGALPQYPQNFGQYVVPQPPAYYHSNTADTGNLQEEDISSEDEVYINEDFMDDYDDLDD